MNGPLSSAGAGGFISSLKAISESGKTSDGAAVELQDIEFSDLIDQQNAVPELLDALKGLLPEQDFSQIEAFVGGGKSLPPAADPGFEFQLIPATADPGFEIHRIPTTTDPDFEIKLIPSESPLPLAASLAVARQQLTAARMSDDALTPAVRLPLSETSLLPALADAKALTAGTRLTGVALDAATAAPSGGEQAVTGFATQLLSADIESINRTRRSALQEGASAAVISPMSALKVTEAAMSMRFGSPSQLSLDIPLAAKGWEQGVGDRIMLMLGSSVQGASLRINPAHLGPIEIQLSMHQDQATVTFNAQHAVVREALEASIPRLREMFQENNLQLAHVGVGQSGNSGRQAGGGGAREGQDEASRDMLDGPGYDNTGTEDQVVLQSAVDGLLNDYA